MKIKSAPLLAFVILALAVFAGCAQNSTNTTDDNPAMQEAVSKGVGASVAAGAAAGTDTTRTAPKGGTSGSKVALSADPTGALKYNTTKLNANAGNVTVAFVNESSVPHNVTVEDSGGKELGATKDVTKGNDTLKLDNVKPGTYTFFCSIPGHEQAGMKGTLTVR
jgi:plastocyanin